MSDIMVKGTSLPYITMEIRQMVGQHDYLTKMANKTGSPYLQQAFQQIRNKVTYSIRKARADYYSKTIEENKDGLQKTWKVLKQAINKNEKSTVINQINRGGKVITEKQEICENSMSTLYLIVKSLPLKFHSLLTRHFIIYQKLRKLMQTFILNRYIQIRFTDYQTSLKLERPVEWT